MARCGCIQRRSKTWRRSSRAELSSSARKRGCGRAATKVLDVCGKWTKSRRALSSVLDDRASATGPKLNLVNESRLANTEGATAGSRHRASRSGGSTDAHPLHGTKCRAARPGDHHSPAVLLSVLFKVV